MRRPLGVAIVFLLPAGAAAAPDSTSATEQARLCIDLPKDEGVQACRRALALGLSPQRSEAVRLVLARELGALGRWEEAVAVYRESARVRPDDPEAHLRLGSALLLGLNRPEEAAGSLREAIRLRPREARAHGLLGIALNDLGRHAEAVAALEQALRLDPAYFEQRPAARATLEAARRGEVWP